MKRLASFLLLICFFLTAGLINTEAQVTVKLQQPPPNQLRATDIWNLTLNNSTRNTIQVVLSGTLESAGEGIIVDGTSQELSLPPGTKRISYEDVKSGKVNFKSGKWREAFTRTGNAPSGDYTICVYVKDKSGEEIGTDCIEQKIEISGPPQLISPANGEELTEGTLPNFTWLPPMPVPPGAQYAIKIVEIIGNQSPEEAIKRNRALVEKKGIKSTMYQYSLSDRSLDKGKKYAWFISAENGNESEIFSFSIIGTNQLMGGANADFKLDTIYCLGQNGNSKKYHIKATYKNLSSSTNNILINDMLPFPGNALPVPAGAGYNLHNNIRTKSGSYNGALTMANILESSNGTISNIIPPPNTFIASLAPGTGVTFDFDFTTAAASTNIIFYGLVDDALKAGTNKNSRNEILTINNFPECPCSFCEEDMIRFNGPNTITDANNILTLNANISIGINITQFKAELIGFSYMPQNKNEQCWVCNQDDSQWGNFVSGKFTSPFSPMVNGVFPSLPCCGGNSHHTIGWWGNAVMVNSAPLVLKISLPPASTLSCCPFNVEFCIRYTFTDKECRSCSVVKCYKYVRQPKTDVIIDHHTDDPK
ncbi:MAG: hypothetical protein V1720_22025 [bacterium]